MPKEMKEFLEDFAELLDKHNILVQVTPKGLCFNFHTKLILETNEINAKIIEKMLEDIEEKRG